MRRLGTLIVRHSKITLFGFVALIALSSIWGFQSFGNLKGGGYDNPNADSAAVGELLTSEFGVDPAEVIILVDLPQEADATDANGMPVSFELVQNLNDELAAIEGVKGVLNYYTLGSPPSLRSTDGKAIYVFVDLENDIKQAPVVATIVDDFTGDYQGAQVHVAGFGAITKAINETIEHDLIRAETIAVPIVLFLLIFVFGSVTAASLPLVVGGLAIVGTFFVIWAASQFTDISIFALNLVTGLGLGLGIDYSLLVVNRFREERGVGNSVSESVVNTVASAGKTVVFSGLTVAVVMLSMAFFPQYFLQSFALAGFTVVILAVIGAMVAVPAMLNLIGDRVNSLRIIKRDLTPKEKGGWEKLARFTMRKPLSVLFVSLIFLISLFSLSSEVKFGQVDDRVLPAGSPALVASELIRDRFEGRESSPIEILVKGDSASIQDYIAELEQIPDVIRVAEIPTEDNTAWTRIEAIADLEPRSPEGLEQIVQIRAIDNSLDEVLVGGSAAYYTDSQQGIEKALPLAAGWIIISTLILLFLFTGSVILPIKAIVLNILSLGATLGLVSWIFQNGHLQWLLGEYSVTGTIDTSSVVMIAVVAFGLSMDYELFLLSRIKEQHDVGMNTVNSVAIGLQRSGRIITAAAIVLAVTFSAFATSGVSIMKMLGVGIAFAILLDATVVRALLVPALMRLFGAANWWAPKWLKRLYEKAGLSH
ncbi:MAG: MMPL family transporter [Aquiluna sp.]|nr:MMPL family transporter [Aquiluna sp.]MCF8545741.1 MMPL family transporter [Aquiluna sp.]